MPSRVEFAGKNSRQLAGDLLEERTMEGSEVCAAVAIVELPEVPERNTTPWHVPNARHEVVEVVDRFDDLEKAREVAYGLNRQAVRFRSRRWALIVEGAEDAWQVGFGSVIAPATEPFAMSMMLLKPQTV